MNAPVVIVFPEPTEEWPEVVLWNVDRFVVGVDKDTYRVAISGTTESNTRPGEVDVGWSPEVARRIFTAGLAACALAEQLGEAATRRG